MILALYTCPIKRMEFGVSPKKNPLERTSGVFSFTMKNSDEPTSNKDWSYWLERIGKCAIVLVRLIKAIFF